MNGPAFLSDADKRRLRKEKDRSMRIEVAKHLSAGTTGSGSQSMTISAEVYRDPARWAAEKKGVFLQQPLLACLSNDLPNAGDRYVFDAAGPSILLVRNREGRVNAFLNMCAHRAARLVDEVGSRKSITCPFHGWTFDLNGELLDVPRRECFDGADLATRKLVRVPVAEWNGMIFVKATPGEAPINVEEFLGEIAVPMALLELDKAWPVSIGRLDARCNWKYVLDTYFESYHVPFLHTKTIMPNFDGSVGTLTHYGRHHEFGFATNQFQHAIKTTNPESDSLEGSTVRFLVVFPNISLNFFPVSATERAVNIHRIFPGDTVDQAFSLMTTYKLGSPVTEHERERYTQTHDMVMNIVGSEDYEIARKASVNLRHAPPGFRFAYGSNEAIVQEIQKEIASAAGMPLD